jgi:hypothetical protein
MRSQEEIEKSTARLFKIVWWQQHEFSKESEEEETKEILKQIEEEIPKEELTLENFNYSMNCGKLTALMWVLGKNQNLSVT